MHSRLRWLLICGALAVTVVYCWMTHPDPVWFNPNGMETKTQPTSPKTAADVHSSTNLVTQKGAKGVHRAVGVQILDPIVYSEPCNGTIKDSRRTTLFKDYDKVQHYLDDLFGSIADINALPKDAEPVFITGASSNHLQEVMIMFDNVNSVVRKMKPKLRMIFYDLGLQAGEPEKIKSVCQCEYRQFPFDKFPQHVKALKGYAFKPLSIMMVLQEYPFALWMDASIRFKPSNILDCSRWLDV